MKYLRLYTAILVILSTSNLVAQETEQRPRVRFLIGAAFEFGGDELAKVFFKNGSTQSLEAGRGLSLFIGGQIRFPKVDKLLIRTTIGYKFITSKATNAEISITRIPIDFTANWMATKDVRLGAGISLHQNIRFNADGLGQDVTFKGAAGPVFEVAYRWIGLRYTSMNYRDQFNNSYSANSFGFTLTAVIPKD